MDIQDFSGKSKLLVRFLQLLLILIISNLLMIMNSILKVKKNVLNIF